MIQNYVISLCEDDEKLCNKLCNRLVTNMSVISHIEKNWLQIKMGTSETSTCIMHLRILL